MTKFEHTRFVNSVIFNSVAEYVSAEGKKKVSMMFANDGGQPCFEITKTVIRVWQKYRVGQKPDLF